LSNVFTITRTARLRPAGARDAALRRLESFLHRNPVNSELLALTG
jgi:hypothetical protein